MTQVTIEAVKGDLTGFKAGDLWYNSTKKGQVITGLAKDLRGAVVELKDYKVNGDWHNVGQVAVISGGTTKPASKAKASGGWKEDPKKQDLIVRQNALTNAVAFCVGSGKAKSPDEVIGVMEKFAAAVLKGSAPVVVEDKPAATEKPKAAAKKPAEEVPVVDFEDEIPF